MRNFIKWTSLAVLFSLFSCAKYEYTGGVFDFSEPGVYGYITPIEIEGAPGTKATVDPRTMIYHFEVGDRINIWSSTGTTLLYNVEAVNAEGRATFSGGGFTLAEGETYYSSHPLIRSTADDYKSLSTSYEGQIQKANDNANHIADYTYTYSSAICENGNTSFQYHHLCSFFLFHVTLPEAMTLKELSITAVDGNDSFFALDGKADVSNGSFVPGRTADTMTLGLDNIQVDDKVLWAYLSVAPVPAGKYIVRVKDSENNVYTSLQVSQNAVTAGKGAWFITEVFPGENPPVAKIGDVVYSSLKAAVDAVTTNEETTITMIGDDNVDVVSYAITVASGKNVIIDLNGHTVAGVCTTGATSALIRNLGTLKIMDSSGTGKMTMNADPYWIYSEADPGGYASNLIRNEGILEVNGGTLYNAGTGSATYAIDNYNSGKVTINDGTVDAKKASAIRMFYNNGGIVTVNGGTIGHYNSDDDYSYMGIQAQNGSNAVIIVTGGNIAGDYALYSNASGSSAVTISGGSFDGYVGFAAAGPTNLSITGGMFNSWVGTWGSLPGFITGGIFAGDPTDYVAEDYIVIDNTDPETKYDYPYTVVQDTNVYVATIGSTKYLTLEAAFAAAEDGDTITLLANSAGNGIVAPQGKFTNGVTVDFNGFKYTMDGTMVGSTGTQTQAFQLLKDNKITFKNGTIESSKALMLIQNYSDLTLEGMTLSLNTIGYNNLYTLSNNNGNVVIDGTTINAASTTNSFAFDVCRYSSYPSVNVTVKGSSTINGNVEFDAGGGNPMDGVSLTIEGGTLTGDLLPTTGGATALTDSPDKAFVTKSDAVALDAPAGFKWESNGDGTSTLVACNYVAKIGDVEYETLEAAFAAAQDGETITLLANSAGNGIVAPQGKFTNGVTVDFNGFTYTMDGAMVGSTGTQTQAFQLLKDNKITFKNGTIESSKALMLIQNYSDLTLEGMTLSLNTTGTNNLYTLSNNNGNVVIDGTTINAASTTNSFAFDVCRYSSYPSVNVTVKGSSVINGDVEVSASGSDPKDGFGLTVEAGTFNGNLVIDGTAATAMANTPEKAVITKDNNVSLAAPSGFKWVDNGDGTSTLKAVVNVAKIGSVEYETLEAAFAAAQDSETITLLANSAGNGIIAPQGKFSTSGLTLDFNGHTYEFSGRGVGSNGTENNGFQLLMGNTITFKNGTLTATSEDAGFLIQNYSNLTLQNMTVDGSNIWGGYVISNNNGNVLIDGSTITAPSGDFAFDVCRYASYPSVYVTVTGNSAINGKIEVSASASNASNGFGLTLNAGTFNGDLVIDGSAATAMANTPDKAVVKKNNNVSLDAPEDFKWVDNGDGTSTLKAVVNVAQIGTTKYETLEEAFAAVQDGQTITLMADCAGNGIVAPQGKFTSGVTVDFNGFTYTMDGAMVGSTGTQTLAFQLLKDNKITFKNGTITSAKAKMLVQNYSDLTLDNMTLTLNNPSYASAYTLSNNNGNVVIKDTEINANPAGGFAFDVCRYATYPSVNVTVKGSSAINGNIEVSASGSDPLDGFSLTLEAGTISGNIVLDQTAKNVIASNPQKAVIKKSNSLTAIAAPADYKWVDNGDGTSTLAPTYVTQIGGTKYETLEAAFAAATDGATITLLADCAGNGIFASPGRFTTDGLTVDFNSYTYTVDGETVGSSGYETQGFHLEQNNKITFKNGEITSSKAKMLIQNYSDLTLEGMTITLNNPNYTSAYTLSNNNGNVVIDATRIEANPAGGFAFDVCRYSSYPSVNVTVKSGSIITGNVEVSASGSDAKDGFSLLLETAISGNIVIDNSAAQAMAATPDKATVRKLNAVSQNAPTGFVWVNNGDGTDKLVAE
ncbi:MAG: hypothetical protein J6U22_05530 [Bacteroidaceae bacterium]|nr:hypothetical protein [Bacteroidaceae bacterium]